MALAVRVSVSAAWPVAMRPSSSSRTETWAWASVPSVTACTWNRRSTAVCGVTCWMALNTASTGPSPVADADPQRLDLDAIGAPAQGVVHQGHDVVVEHMLLLVRQVFEPAEGFVERV